MDKQAPSEPNSDSVEVYDRWHYDAIENILYVHGRKNYYYKLDGESIKKRPNGEEIYFRDPAGVEEIEYIPREEREYPDEVYGQMGEWKDEGSFLHKVMVNRTNFAPKTALPPRQQRLQHLITLYIYPFADRFSAKPITVWVGPKCSGKTFTMRMIARLLMGMNYEVSPLPANEKDFLVAAYNSPLYFIDNLDTSRDWLNRYELVEGKVNSWLGVNVRDHCFIRGDVVDSLLIFYVERLNENLDPDFMLRVMRDYYDVLWSEYLDDLNKIVKAWKDVDESKMTSSHRMVGWSVFAKVVQEALNIPEEEVNGLITKGGRR